MEVFIRVVETGGFTAAAQQCGMTPSAVSKLVARLEDRLGARLFNRSTRRQQLTAEGAAFYERSLRILADLDEAEREASASAEPWAGYASVATCRWGGSSSFRRCRCSSSATPASASTCN